MPTCNICHKQLVNQDKGEKWNLFSDSHRGVVSVCLSHHGINLLDPLTKQAVSTLVDAKKK